MTSLDNAWRLAEAGIVPFTTSIEKGKYDRPLDALLAATPAGSLPIEGAHPVVDIGRALRLYFELEMDQYHRNLYTELFIRAFFSYAIPSNAALEKVRELASRGSVIELGAGRAYWAALLSNLGVKITAYDSAVISENEWHSRGSVEYPEPILQRCDKQWFPTGLASFEPAGTAAKDDVLLLIWPPKESSFATEAVRRFGGSVVIYVGEPDAMGCAEPEFFDEVHSNGWSLDEVMEIPRLPWHYDELFVYRR